MISYIKKEVLRVKDNEVKEINDPIAVEKRLRLSVNGKEILSLFCTPVMIRELIMGFLMTEGIIKGSWCSERMSIEYGEEITVDVPAEGEVIMNGKSITSGCVGGITLARKIDSKKIKDNLKISRDALIKSFREFQFRSEPYKLTGCIHSAAISDGKRILVFAEDIGRHNAVDKVIGYCLLEDIPFKRKIMLVSGRLSSEIGSKCAKWSIPVVASRTAPTLLSIEIADKKGITMIGFLRGNRFNIYTHPERIINNIGTTPQLE